MRGESLVRLVSCAAHPVLPDDDRLLHDELARSVPVEVVTWDDPAVDWAAGRVTALRSVLDYHLHRPRFLEWAWRAGARTALLNPPHLLAWNSHKSYLRDLARAGVPVIPTEWLGSGSRADLAEIMARRGWPAVVVKPAVSASAHRTLPVDRDGMDAGQAHLDALLRDGADAMVQRYLPEIAADGELSVIWVAGEQTHAVRRPSGLHSTIEELVTGTPARPGPRALALATAVYRLVHPEPCYARVDIVETAAGEQFVLELELIEPALYFRHSERAVRVFGAALRALAGRPAPAETEAS